MKKSPSLLVGLLAAAITFGGLYATLGRRHFGGPFATHHRAAGRCVPLQNSHPKSGEVNVQAQQAP